MEARTYSAKQVSDIVKRYTQGDDQANVIISNLAKGLQIENPGLSYADACTEFCGELKVSISRHPGAK